MKTRRFFRPWVFGVLTLAFLAAAACVRLGMKHARSREPQPRVHAAVPGLGPDRLVLPRPARSTHRIVLDEAALERLRAASKARTPAFGYVLARADEAREKPLASGYQGFDWADAVANSALVWHATGDERYAAS
ncbi:MAG TPA: hypothetical protein VGQ57_01485, partial [Polyangiaceae bacterium]|nr:hypothetical protein [Polyangiaceae bacterium]